MRHAPVTSTALLWMLTTANHWNDRIGSKVINGSFAKVAAIAIFAVFWCNLHNFGKFDKLNDWYCYL
jgi:hypothetical protein